VFIIAARVARIPALVFGRRPCSLCPRDHQNQPAFGAFTQTQTDGPERQIYFAKCRAKSSRLLVTSSAPCNCRDNLLSCHRFHCGC